MVCVCVFVCLREWVRESEYECVYVCIRERETRKKERAQTAA